MYRWSMRWDECAAALASALEVIPPSPPSAARVEALADAALGHCYAGRAAEARSCAEEAMAVAALLDDADSHVFARYSMGSAISMTEPVEVVLDHQAATVAMCGPDVSPEQRILAYNGLTNALVRVGRLTELIDVAAAGVELVRTTGLGGPLGPAMAQYWVGCLVTLGRWAEAEAVSDELRELIGQAHERDLCIYMERALIRQGRVAEAQPKMRRLKQLLQQSDYWTETLAELGAVFIEFDAADGHREDVIALVDDLLVGGDPPSAVRRVAPHRHSHRVRWPIEPGHTTCDHAKRSRSSGVLPSDGWRSPRASSGPGRLRGSARTRQSLRRVLSPQVRARRIRLVSARCRL